MHAPLLTMCVSEITGFQQESGSLQRMIVTSVPSSMHDLQFEGFCEARDGEAESTGKGTCLGTIAAF